MAERVILIIDDDDQFTGYIGNEIQHAFPGFRVFICHGAAQAKREIAALGQTIEAAVFDSGFRKNKLAGCELFLELIAAFPWIKGRTVFHTAFDEEVHEKLVRTGCLAESRLIGKSIDSLESLNNALGRILQR